MFLFRQTVRLLRVMAQFPDAATLWLMYLIGKIPLFTYVYERHTNTTEKRAGFADGYSVGRLSFVGWELVAKRVASGSELSAYHFYLARPVRNYLRSLPVLPYTALARRGRVLEIGCGAGRMLGAFLDRYGGHGVGVDLHEPALAVGKVSVISEEMVFERIAISLGNEVEQAFPEQFALVLFSSSLVHIPRDNGCRVELLRSLMRQSLCIVGHERNTPELLEDLHSLGIRTSVRLEFITFEWFSPEWEGSC